VSLVNLGASSLLFCFWSSISTFCRLPSVVYLFEDLIYLKEKREGKISNNRENILGKKKVIATSLKV
jgi:hypothetical protein